MAQTARTYTPRRRYDEVPAPQIEVHRGQGRRLDAGQYQHAVSVFKIVLSLIAIVCVVSVLRICFVNASMVTLTEASKITSQLDEARAMESSLELKYYTMTNASSLKPYAADKLGMVAATAESASYVDLTPEFLKAQAPQVIDKALTAQAEIAAQDAAAQKYVGAGVRGMS